jgi:hypothetical protein
MAKENYQNKIFSLLKELKKKYPSFSIGRHISSCVENHEQLWGITDKELYHELEKYSLELSFDEQLNTNLDIEDIIKDAKSMFDDITDDFSDLDEIND